MSSGKCLSDVVDLTTAGESLVGVAGPQYCEKAIGSRGIQVDPLDFGFYVEPSFTFESVVSDASFALISAPAAVGKTTFAQALHKQLFDAGRQVLYVPLKDERIGSNYFSGMVSSIYPDHTKKEIMGMIGRGEIVVIFDGYDEVSMTVEQIDLNKMFINEVLSELSGVCSGRVVVYFLFRSVFYGLGIFDDLLSRSVRIKLEFFDARKREEFLLGYLEVVKGINNARQLVRDLLGAFEDKIGVAGNKDAEAFFGHAIVLQAFGDYVCARFNESENLLSVANALVDRRMDERASLGILKGVFDSILIREAGKFSKAIFDGKVNDFEPFSQDVQEKLLSALAEDVVRSEVRDMPRLHAEIMHISEGILSMPEVAALDQPIKDKLVSDYQVELLNKISHHPFVDKGKSEIIRFRNPVYFEYYLARCLSASKDGFRGVLAGHKNASHFVAMFFLSMISGRDVSGYDGAVYFISSLYRGSGMEDEDVLRINFSGGAWKIEIGGGVAVTPFFYSEEILDIGVPAGGVMRGFQISGGEMVVFSCDAGDDYRARTEIANGWICSDCVEFSGGVVVFDEVVIDSGEIVFDEGISEVEGGGTVLISKASSDVILKMSDHLSKQLKGAIVFASSDDGFPDREIRRAVGKILTKFRRHKRDEFACYVKKFDTWILAAGRDEVTQAVANVMLSVGILRRTQELVYFSEDFQSEYGICYIKQNEVSISDEGVGKLKLRLQSS